MKKIGIFESDLDQWKNLATPDRFSISQPAPRFIEALPPIDHSKPYLDRIEREEEQLELLRKQVNELTLARAEAAQRETAARADAIAARIETKGAADRARVANWLAFGALVVAALALLQSLGYFA